MNCSSDNEDKLTEEQNKLVEQNHNLIYKFAHKKNISIDEYYGVLAIGLCKAAKSFDENKGMFSTFAYRCMCNELNTYWRKLQNKSSVPQDAVLYYDSTLYDNKTLLENFSDNYEHDSMIYDIISKEFVNSLSGKEKIIASFLISGLTYSDIAEKLNCKRQNVYYYIKKIKDSAKIYLNK